MNSPSLYASLPVSLQNLACTAEGWRVHRARYTTGFYAKLKEMESRTFWPEERLREFRDARIRSFVSHCEERVPYYRRRFKKLGITAKDIRGLDDLKYLPVLTKPEVQERTGDFRAEDIRERVRQIHTSGTTGTGLIFGSTQSAVEEQWAVWWRYRRWHGIPLHTWCAYFGGRSVVPIEQQNPPYWRINYAGRQLFFSAYHITPENVRFYLEKLRIARLPWLHGYPSVIALMAGFILDSGWDLGYEPRWITTGAENLLAPQSEIIARAFGVRPIEHYGTAEAAANISQCERAKLHVDEDFAGTEFIPDEGGTSKVIGTNFTNFATPLLRYDVQDEVRLSADGCSCGRPGRVVESIDGRQEDYVVLANGAKIGRLDHIFKDMTTIREAQIVQHAPGCVTVRVVRGPIYSDCDEQRLRREFVQRVGSSTVVQIVYADTLMRSRTGKLRFVISELRKQAAAN